MQCQAMLSKQVQILSDKLKNYNYQLLMNQAQNPNQFLFKLQDLISIPHSKILTPYERRESIDEGSLQKDIKQSLQDEKAKGEYVYRIIDWYLGQIKPKQNDKYWQSLSTEYNISRIKLYQQFSYQLLTKRINIKNNSYFLQSSLNQFRKRLQCILKIINSCKSINTNINIEQIQFEIYLLFNEIQIAENFMQNQIINFIPKSPNPHSNQCSRLKIEIIAAINQNIQFQDIISFGNLKKLFKICTNYFSGILRYQIILKIKFINFHKFIENQLKRRHDEIIKNHYGLCKQEQYETLKDLTNKSYKANPTKALLPVKFPVNRTEYIALKQLYLLLRTRQLKFLREWYQKQNPNTKADDYQKIFDLAKQYKHQVLRYFQQVTTDIDNLLQYLQDYSKMVLYDITRLQSVIYHLLQYQAPLLERLQFYLIWHNIKKIFGYILTQNLDSLDFLSWRITDIQTTILIRAYQRQQIAYFQFDMQKIQYQIFSTHSQQQHLLKQILAFLKLNQYLSLNRQKIQAYKQAQKSKQSYTAYKLNRFKQLTSCIQQFSSSERKSHLQQIKDKILLLIAQYLMDDFQSISIDKQKRYVILRQIPLQIQNLIMSMAFDKNNPQINRMNNSKCGIVERRYFLYQYNEDFLTSLDLYKQNSTGRTLKHTESFVQVQIGNIHKSYTDTQKEIKNCLKKNNNQEDTRNYIKNKLQILKQDLFLLKMKEKSLERCLIANQYQSFLKKHFKNPNQQSIISKIIKIQRHFYMGQYNDGWVLYQLQSEKQGFYNFIDDNNQDMLFLSKIWFKVKAFQQFGLQDNPQFQKDCVRKLKLKFQNNPKFQMINNIQSIVRQLIKLKTIQKLSREKKIKMNFSSYKKVKNTKQQIIQEDFQTMFNNRINKELFRKLFGINQQNHKCQIYWMTYNNNHQKDYIRILITKKRQQIDKIYDKLTQYLFSKNIININIQGVSKMLIKDIQYFCQNKVKLTIDIDFNFMPVQVLKENIDKDKQMDPYQLQVIKIKKWLNNIIYVTREMSKLQFYPTSLIKKEDICFQQSADSKMIKYYFNPYFAILQSIFNQKQPLSQQLQKRQQKQKRQYPYHVVGNLLQKIINFQMDPIKNSSFWYECMHLSQQMLLFWNKNNINDEAISKFYEFPVFKSTHERILFYKTFYNLLNRSHQRNKQRGYIFNKWISRGAQWQKMLQSYFNPQQEENKKKYNHFQYQADKENIFIKKLEESQLNQDFIDICSKQTKLSNFIQILTQIRALFCHNSFGNQTSTPTAISGYRNDHEKLQIVQKQFPKLMTFLYSRDDFLKGSSVSSIWSLKTKQCHHYYQFKINFRLSFPEYNLQDKQKWQSLTNIQNYFNTNSLQQIDKTNYRKMYIRILQLRIKILQAYKNDKICLF